VEDKVRRTNFFDDSEIAIGELIHEPLEDFLVLLSSNISVLLKTTSSVRYRRCAKVHSVEETQCKGRVTSTAGRHTRHRQPSKGR
jgi:hypothetical protein